MLATGQQAFIQETTMGDRQHLDLRWPKASYNLVIVASGDGKFTLNQMSDVRCQASEKIEDLPPPPRLWRDKPSRTHEDTITFA